MQVVTLETSTTVCPDVPGKTYPPPTKIILVKAKCNGRKFIHICIWVSSIPSQIDKCVIWLIFSWMIEKNVILFSKYFI